MAHARCPLGRARMPDERSSATPPTWIVYPRAAARPARHRQPRRARSRAPCARARVGGSAWPSSRRGTPGSSRWPRPSRGRGCRRALRTSTCASFRASRRWPPPRAGAPLGHDFAVISLSDQLKPWAVDRARLAAAAGADLALALYNPASQTRASSNSRARRGAARARGPTTPVVVARAVGSGEEVVDRHDARGLDSRPSSYAHALSWAPRRRATCASARGGRPLVYTPRSHPGVTAPPASSGRRRGPPGPGRAASAAQSPAASRGLTPRAEAGSEWARSHAWPSIARPRDGSRRLAALTRRTARRYHWPAISDRGELRDREWPASFARNTSPEVGPGSCPRV